MSWQFTPELAYIGPGAGFAFLGSFLTLIGGVLLRGLGVCGLAGVLQQGIAVRGASAGTKPVSE